MLFFTLTEFLNKLIGLILVAFIARELGVDGFASYALAMVIFGYFVEISYYSLQNKHLFSYGENPDSYLISQAFATRLIVMLCFSFVSFLFFNFVGYFYLDANILPLSLILILSILNFDFILHVRSKSNYLVLARFCSQIFFLLILYLSVKFQAITTNNIMFYQMLNSLILIVIVLMLTKHFKYLNFRLLLHSLKIGFEKFNDFKFEIKNQFSNFSLKIMTLAIVTIEMPIMLLMSQKVVDNLAISHRLALIFLPFIIFYLNLNSKNISEKDLINKTIFSTLISIFLIALSMLIIRIVFGEYYVQNAQLYALFFSVIPFQTLLNYLFFLASKDSLEKIVYLKLGLIGLIYIAIVLGVSIFADLSVITLSFLIFIKYISVIFIFSIISFKNRFYTILLISASQFFSYYLYYSGDFRNENYLLIEKYNNLLKYFSMHF